MLLYTFTITPNNRKVEAFVKHYDLDVDIHHVSFKDREQLSSEFLAINPMAKVPALVDGDFKLWESNAILTYLASTFPETKALPSDIRGRADVDRWLHWQSCHLLPAIVTLKVSDEKDLDAVTPLLKILEVQLDGKDFVLGQLGVTDFAIAAYTLSKLGRKLDYSETPNLAAWRERVSNLKGFVETQVKRPPAAA